MGNSDYAGHEYWIIIAAYRTKSPTSKNFIDNNWVTLLIKIIYTINIFELNFPNENAK